MGLESEKFPLRSLAIRASIAARVGLSVTESRHNENGDGGPAGSW
jgi:hypothetical protein